MIPMFQNYIFYNIAEKHQFQDADMVLSSYTDLLNIPREYVLSMIFSNKSEDMILFVFFIIPSPLGQL